MVTAAVVSAAACGASSTPTAERELGGADSWHFELTTTTAPEDPNELRFSGVFDRARQLGRMQIDAPREEEWFFTSCEYESGRHYPEDELLVRGKNYSRWLAWGKSYWIAEEVSPATVDYTDLLASIAPFPIGFVSPTDVVARMRRYSDGVETLGSEFVRGRETTHVRAQVDMRRFFSGSPEVERPPDWVVNRPEQLQDLLEVDAWIDSAGRVRRMILQLNVEHGGRLGDVMTYSLELFEFGVGVYVQEPGSVVTREEYYSAAEKGWPVNEDECVQWRPEEEEGS
jgi:hypothetical protein